MKVQWYEGLDGLASLRDDWHRLHSTAPLFARYEWYLAAATHLVPPQSDVSFCRISDRSGQPVAIIPAITGRVIAKPFGYQPAITLGLHDNLPLFDFPLAPAADITTVATTMMEATRERSFPWRVVSWSRVMANSNAARVAMALKDSRVLIQASSPCNTIDTSHADVPVHNNLSSKLRCNLRRYRKLLSKLGPVKVRMARDEGAISEFFEEFLRIEAAGWKGVAGTRSAITFVPGARAFYESVIAQHSREFESDIALLYTCDRAIAGQLLIRAGRWEHVYKIGYDESFAKYAPGQLLFESVLQRGHASGSVDRVSLVTGLPWHDNWSPIAEPTLAVSIFRDTWRPSIIRMARIMKSRIKEIRTS